MAGPPPNPRLGASGTDQRRFQERLRQTRQKASKKAIKPQKTYDKTGGTAAPQEGQEEIYAYSKAK